MGYENSNHHRNERALDNGESAWNQNNGQRIRKPPVTLPTGAIYEGEWKNDMRDGYGK